MWNMRKLSTFSKRRNEVKDENKYPESQEENICIIDWEVRPGGLLVQKRGGVSAEANSVMIKIKVSYDSCYHDLTLPAESTFGDLKKLLTDRTGLHPTVQRLLFQGKEKDGNECLHIAGVKDMSKLILMEDPASKEMKKIQGTSVSCEAIARVRLEVDKLSHRVVSIEEAVQKGMKVEDMELVVISELFIIQLLTLDSIEADGEARTQRKEEARNSNLHSQSNVISMGSSKWETFDSGVGSLNAPNRLHQSTKITQEWEQFD